MGLNITTQGDMIEASRKLYTLTNPHSFFEQLSKLRVLIGLSKAPVPANINTPLDSGSSSGSGRLSAVSRDMNSNGIVWKFTDGLLQMFSDVKEMHILDDALQFCLLVLTFILSISYDLTIYVNINFMDLTASNKLLSSYQHVKGRSHPNYLVENEVNHTSLGTKGEFRHCYIHYYILYTI